MFVIKSTPGNYLTIDGTWDRPARLGWTPTQRDALRFASKARARDALSIYPLAGARLVRVVKQVTYDTQANARVGEDGPVARS